MEGKKGKKTQRTRDGSKRNGFYSFVYILVWIFVHLIFRIKVIGRERIPKDSAVMCCNHSSNWDPVLVLIAAGYGNQVYAMAKAEIREWFFVGYLLDLAGMIFVNRGKADISAIKTAMQYLKTQGKILIFPEGTRVSEEDASTAKGGVSMLAVRTKSPIIPVHIDNHVKVFHSVNIVFGEPYYPTVAERKGTAEEYQEIADETMRRVYALKAECGR